MLALNIALIVGMAMASVGIIKYYFPGYKNDNIIEEISEEVIKEETGLNIDLTPESPENK